MIVPKMEALFLELQSIEFRFVIKVLKIVLYIEITE